MEKRFCKVCGEEIHPLRLKVLPNAVTCVEHSTTGQKRARTLSLGQGDHNYNEIEILEEETYRQVVAIEYGERSPLDDLIEAQDYEATSASDRSGSLQKRARLIENTDDEGFTLPDDYDQLT
tara:strand:+ start:625 stop:990 length:366 start_codon:yes stop_codon:yes gene_type:complete